MISENSWKLRLTVLLVLVQGAQSSFCPLSDGVVQMCQQDSVLGNYLHIDTSQVPNNTAVHCVCDVVLADGVVVEYLDFSGPNLEGDSCGTRFTFNDGSILQCSSSSHAVGAWMGSINFSTTKYATIAACLTLKIGGTANATINCYSHDRTTVTPTLTRTVASPINTTSTLTNTEARTTTTTTTTTTPSAAETTTTPSAEETTTAPTRTTTSTITTTATKTTTTTSYRSTSSTPQTSTFQTPTSSTPSTRTTTLITATLITLVTSPVTRDLQQSVATTASTISEKITTSQAKRTSQPSTITTPSATTEYITTTTSSTASNTTATNTTATNTTATNTIATNTTATNTTSTNTTSTNTTTTNTTATNTTSTNTTATLTTRSTISETSPTSDEATTLRSETSRYDTTLGDEQSSTTNQGTSPKSNVSTIESEATSAITEGMVTLNSTTLSTSPPPPQSTAPSTLTYRTTSTTPSTSTSPSRSPTPLLSTFTRTLISTTTTTTPLTPSTTISTSSLKSTQRLSEAAVVGFIIAAGAVGLILLILLVLVCRTRQKHTENGKEECNHDTDIPDVPIVVHVTAPGTDELYAIVNKRYGIRATSGGPVTSPLPETSYLTPDSSKHQADGTCSRHSDGGQPDDTNTDTYIPLSSYDTISSYSTNNADDSADATYTGKQETSEETSMKDDIETLYSCVSKKSRSAHHSNTLKMSETDETTEGKTKHPDCNTLETDRNIRQMEEEVQVTEGRSYATEGTAQGTDNTTSTLWRYTGDGGQWYFSEIM